MLMFLGVVYKYLRVIAVMGGLSLATQATAQSFTFSQLGLTTGHENNVPRGVDGPHKDESSFLNLNYTLGSLFEIGLKNTLAVSATAGATRYQNLRGFDNFSLAIAANYNYKWALGAYAPIISFNAAFAAEQYEGRARDNNLLTLDINYFKRLSPAWALNLGVDYQKNGSDSLPEDAALDSFNYDPNMLLPFEVYDYESASIYADVEYTFENGVLVNTGIRRVDGATVSSTSQPTLALYKVASAVYPDPAFDGAWLAYQLEADTNEWSAGLSVPIGIDSSVNLSYSFYDIAAVSGNSYLNRIFSVSYVHNF